jgi:hypothetical protein
MYLVIMHLDQVFCPRKSVCLNFVISMRLYLRSDLVALAARKNEEKNKLKR